MNCMPTTGSSCGTLCVFLAFTILLVHLWYRSVTLLWQDGEKMCHGMLPPSAMATIMFFVYPDHCFRLLLGFCQTSLTAVCTCCNRWLTEKEAVAAVGYTHRAYAIAAWRFLTKTGFINFGVAPSMSAKQGSSREAPKGTVIVVGAGMAGKALPADVRCSESPSA